jgi:hypothetical protein
LNNVQTVSSIDAEIKIEEELDLSNQSDALNDKSTVLTKIETFQVVRENIRPETSIDGECKVFFIR